MLTYSSIGTFYNAVRSDKNRQKVKEWAWVAYPEAYEELLKLGYREVAQSIGEGEDKIVLPSQKLFDIGDIGRDVEP